MPPAVNDKPVIRVGGGSSCAIWTLALVGTTDRVEADGRQDFLRAGPITKIAVGAWIYRIADLAFGDHGLAVRQRVYGSSAEALFHIEVDDVP